MSKSLEATPEIQQMINDLYEEFRAKLSSLNNDTKLKVLSYRETAESNEVIYSVMVLKFLEYKIFKKIII